MQILICNRCFYVAVGTTLTHWGRVAHICVGNLTIIGSDTGLSPGQRQAITWTNVGMLPIGPLGTNFNEMLIEIRAFSFKKIHLKMSSGKWRPFFLGLNVLSSCLEYKMFFHCRWVWESFRCEKSQGRNGNSILLVLKPQYSVEQGQCHSCWCPGSLCHQGPDSI